MSADELDREVVAQTDDARRRACDRRPTHPTAPPSLPPVRSPRWTPLSRPAGLHRCLDCGEQRGTVLVPDPPDRVRLVPVTVTCACEGLTCAACGVGRVHRPLTNYLDAATCEVVHVPSFMALRPRRECGARDWVEARYRQK